MPRALLVGVGSYAPPVPALEGPANDVAAMHAALVESWGLHAEQVTILLNEQATKTAILAALDDLHANTEAGDAVFVYFSGHGTSAKDYQLGLPLPTQSGAFIPYDVGQPQSGAEFVDRLIVGRTDLQPRFKRLDTGGRQVLVAIDACYSGNTVRAVHATEPLTARFVDARDLLPQRAFGDDLGGSGFGQQTAEQEPYPYRNVFYIGASGEHEVAQDIPARFLDRLPTIDGKAHGAFSDALVRVLRGVTPADVDRDGYLAYGEIYQALRSLMQERGFSHTPQRLPSIAEDPGDLAERRLLNIRAPAKAPGSVDETVLRVDPGPFTRQLAGIDSTRVRIDLANPGLVLRAERGGVILLSRSGDEVLRLETQDTDIIRGAVLREAAIQRWVAASVQQDFTLSAGLQGQARGSTVRQGEVIGFSMRTSEPAYLVVLNIGPSGTVTMLYPNDERELVQLPARQLMALHDLAVAAPPYGRELVDVLAFTEFPSPLRALLGSSFALDSPQAIALRAVLSDTAQPKARSTFSVYTAP